MPEFARTFLLCVTCSLGCVTSCGGRASDEGRGAAGAGAAAACANCVCGNGVVEADEQCDDGNAVPGHGCSNECNWEPVALACGGGDACALGANGVLKCWGPNDYGELGLGDTRNRGGRKGDMGGALPAVDLGSGVIARQLSVDANVCAILNDGALKCWGDNFYGRLGLGDEQARGDEPGEMGDALPRVDLGSAAVVLNVAAGATTCAVLASGDLKCWGLNASGELGRGDRENRGGKPGEMGDQLPAIDLGRGARVSSVVVGNWHVCALLQSGQVKCWGMNDDGELGQGDTRQRGDDPGELGDSLPPIDLGTGRLATAIASAAFRTCALLDGGEVKCWGYDGDGGLGAGLVGSRGDQPGEMGDALPTINLGAGRRVVQLAGGNEFMCARFDTGAVKCWGLNSNGQLGLGDKVDRGARSQMGDNLPEVDLGTGRRARSICAGRDNACALLDDGRVKCWGLGVAGSLGLGDGETRGDEPGEMGDNLPAVDLRF